MGRRAQGETVKATIWNGVPVVIRTFTDPDTGTRRRAVSQVGDLETAERLAEVTRTRIADGALEQIRKGPAPVTVGQLLDRLCDDYAKRVEDGKARANTEKWTRMMAVPLKIRIGSSRLEALPADVGARHARDRLAASVKPRSVWAELRVLRTALLLAQERGWWKPATGTSVRAMFRDLRPEQLGDLAEIRWLRGDEVGPFLAAVDAEDNPGFGLMCRIALHTGMREAEILALQWQDWHRRDREVSIKREKPAIDYRVKAGKARLVPVNEDLRTALLAEWMRQGQPKGEAWMILRLDGLRRASGSWPCRLVTACASRAGVTAINFHGLRHTFASLALESGAMSLVEVSRILGHADPGFTARLYVHVERRKLAEGTSRLADYYRARMPASKPATANGTTPQGSGDTGGIST